MATSLWSQATETTTSNGAGNAGTVGLHFTVSTSGTLAGLWFYSPAGKSLVSLPATIGLYNYSTKALITSNTASWSGAVGSGWVYAAFTTPPTLAAGTGYMAGAYLNSTAAWFCYTEPYTWPVTSGIVTAPKDTGNGQGWYTNTTTGGINFPASQLAGYNFWVDVSVVTVTNGSVAGLAATGAVAAPSGTGTAAQAGPVAHATVAAPVGSVSVIESASVSGPAATITADAPDDFSVSVTTPLPLASSLQDDFASDDLATLWGNSFGSPVIWGGLAALPCTNSYSSIISTSQYDLTGNYAFCKLTPDQGGSGYEADLFLGDLQAYNGYSLGYEMGNLQAQTWSGNTATSIGSVTYDPVQHAWLMISESAGTITYSASADGLNWNPLWTSDESAYGVTSVYAIVYTGYYPTGTDGTTYVSDFNTPPPPELSTLQDPFAGTTISDQWSPYGTVNVTDGQVSVQSDTGYDSGLVASTSYDLTGSFMMARITATLVNTSGGTWLQANSGAEGGVGIQAGYGGISAYTVDASGTYTYSTGGVTYDQPTMAWWRIREVGGTTFFEYAPDGKTWTQLWSAPDPVDLSNVQVQFGTGIDSGNTDTAYIADFNYLPATPLAFSPSFVPGTAITGMAVPGDTGTLTPAAVSATVNGTTASAAVSAEPGTAPVSQAGHTAATTVSAPMGSVVVSGSVHGLAAGGSASAYPGTGKVAQASEPAQAYLAASPGTAAVRQAGVTAQVSVQVVPGSSSAAQTGITARATSSATAGTLGVTQPGPVAQGVVAAPYGSVSATTAGVAASVSLVAPRGVVSTSQAGITAQAQAQAIPGSASAVQTGTVATATVSAPTGSSTSVTSGSVAGSPASATVSALAGSALVTGTVPAASATVSAPVGSVTVAASGEIFGPSSQVTAEAIYGSVTVVTSGQPATFSINTIPGVSLVSVAGSEATVTALATAGAVSGAVSVPPAGVRASSPVGSASPEVEGAVAAGAVFASPGTASAGTSMPAVGISASAPTGSVTVTSSAVVNGATAVVTASAPLGSVTVTGSAEITGLPAGAVVVAQPGTASASASSAAAAVQAAALFGSVSASVAGPSAGAAVQAPDGEVVVTASATVYGLPAIITIAAPVGFTGQQVTTLGLTIECDVWGSRLQRVWAAYGVTRMMNVSVPPPPRS